MSSRDRSFMDRASAFLLDHVAPCLPTGKRPFMPAAADLEAQARAELQAQIDKGRPGPEEARRTRPRPAWAQPRPRSSRPLDVVAVRLDRLSPAAPAGARPLAREARREPTG